MVLLSPKIKDITGCTSGYLTVISFSHTTKSKSSSSTRTWWNCVCVCGKVVQIVKAHIVSGRRTSCGCMKGRAGAINISGNQYGRLLALYPWETPKAGKHQWVFLCDCGQVVVRDKGSVTTGNTESCGCLYIESSLRVMAEYLSVPRCGKDNPNWRGGITSISVSIRSSLEYRTWRTAVFERDNYTCQDCNTRGSRDLHAHHIIHFSTIRDSYNITTMEEARACALLWDITNGVTVCEDCHLARHGGTWATRKEI